MSVTFANGCCYQVYTSMNMPIFLATPLHGSTLSHPGDFVVLYAPFIPMIFFVPLLVCAFRRHS